MNWGKAIILTFSIFIAFIGFLSYRMITTDVDLVGADYYQKEIEYQKQVELLKNTAALKAKSTFNYNPKTQTISIGFPQKAVNCTIHFYRPDNKKWDFTKSLTITQDTIAQVKLTTLQAGMWKAKVYWKGVSQDYYFEESFNARQND